MIYTSYTFLVILFGSIVIGATSGFLSFFINAKKESMLIDAVAHCSFAGIALTFLFINNVTTFHLYIGALIAAIVSIFLIYVVKNTSIITMNSAIGIILSMMFGLGISSLSIIQRSNPMNSYSLKHYIFGNILYLRREDLFLLLFISAIIFIFVTIFWKQMKTILFDFNYAKSIGLPIRYIELIFLFLLATITIVSVEMIGVIMYAGLLIGPGIAARQISSSYNQVIILSSMIGVFSGIIGSILSASPLSPPAGPSIIAVLGTIVIISIVLARKGGIISLIKFSYIERNHDIKKSFSLLTKNMIMNPRDCDIREFSIKENQKIDLSHHLNLLIKLGYVRPSEKNHWFLTYNGMLLVDQLKTSNQSEVLQ